MANILDSIKAVITRLVFATHGFIAIWQVTIFKKNPFFWYLSSPILLLFFEGIFTLTIKENQEWKWFCPSVFLYLASVVPAIWLLELDKVDRRLRTREETFNLTASANLKDLHNLIGVQIKLPEINLSTETWITLIEQFLMLILIIGRWMLPKGDLTRDQLSQILLVYIGTAADIIEFFDSFKDDKISNEPILVMLTLGIWTWSLMQFTVVLTATKSRKSRMSSSAGSAIKKSKNFCNIDVWGIALNITLQDAPFLAFRLLIITHYNIISYMNVFFTCKNTLVILLQLYRLHVVYSENRKQLKKQNFELTSISIISKPGMYGDAERASKRKSDKNLKKHNSKDKGKRSGKRPQEVEDNFSDNEDHCRSTRKTRNNRKDTGYSTGSSHASTRYQNKKTQCTKNSKDGSRSKDKRKLERSDGDTKEHGKREVDRFSEESSSGSLSFDPNEPERTEFRKEIKKINTKKKGKSTSTSRSTSTSSSD